MKTILLGLISGVMLSVVVTLVLMLFRIVTL